MINILWYNTSGVDNMKVIDTSIKSFVDKYKNKYVFRIRKDKTLVYYKGIQAFILKEDKNKNIDISISKSTFKCNPTAMVNYNGDYKNDLMNLCKSLSMTMNNISFEIATNYDEIEVRNCLDDFFNYCDLKFVNLINREGVIKKLDFLFENLKTLSDIDDIKDYEKKNKININFNYKLKDINDIIDIQYNFYNKMIISDNIIVKNRIKSINFSYSIKIENNLDTLINTVEKSIDNYSGSDCLEKKYQQQFMLNASKSDIFLKSVIPFEEEYPLINYKRKENDICKTGRIDTVFYSYQKKEITDIYLIELKVDEKVILGNNGVLTHLDDIQNIIDNCNKKQKKFFDDLIKNINYTNSILGILQCDFKYSKNLKIHFYTICGFTNKDSRKLVKDLISKLSNVLEINKLCDNNKLPSWCKEKTIKMIGKEVSEKYYIKFFYEKNNWTIDNPISMEFDDVTKDIYK